MRLCICKMDWNLARAFCITAETGSLSAAARKLGLTQPTLSRQVAALEEDLKVLLFERVGKKLLLTDAGAGLLEHARAMEMAADAMTLAAAGQAGELEGPVSISAIDSYWAYVLPSIVKCMREQAPQVTLVAVATDAISDLRRREADIAIRHVRPNEPDLIARWVGDTTAHFYASERWVSEHGMPRTVHDLHGAEWLAIQPVAAFASHLAGRGIVTSETQFRLISDSSVVLWEMVQGGLGVGLTLPEIGESTPGVVRLLPSLPGPRVPVWLVCHRELHTSQRVRWAFDTLFAALQVRLGVHESTARGARRKPPPGKRQKR